ncbi:MAG: carbon starvation protein A [Syntrophothermus sp.]
MIALVVIASIVILIAAYVFYGRFISKRIEINDTIATPACEMNDGVDYVPAKYSLLLGQHFSAIAAAGPIVGPILAGLWFGWVPAILWIILGSIFVGGVHDFTSLIASIRHKAVSIGEVLKQYMSPYSHKIFLIFIWLTLVYVIIAFTDITAQTFINVSKADALGPGVASASIIYLLLGVAMGIVLYKFKANLKITTVIFIPILIFVIYYCANLPQPLVNFFSGFSVKQWDTILLVYCFIASILPMWLLLQPRGYLGGWFLYLTIAISLMGSLFGGFTINYPAFNTEGLKSIDNAKMLFPLLFITIACGACSGFHGIVSSGTTSKQIEKESDAKRVGYGAMLLEALVAVLALGTVMMLSKGSDSLKADPNMIYAKGIANYLGLIGVDPNLALSFALLAFATFVYDTLDVTTRLGRYIIQELFGWNSKAGAYLAAFVTLLLPFIFLMISDEKAYLSAWALFGSSNQLLASLVLIAVSVWLFKTGKKYYYALWPAILMTTMTLWSLILLIVPFVKDTLNFWVNTSKNDIISGVVGIILLLMSIFIITEAFKILVLKPKSPKINVQQV